MNCVMIQNPLYNRSYIAENTQSTANTWERATITFPVDTGNHWSPSGGRGSRMSGSSWQSPAPSPCQTDSASSHPAPRSPQRRTASNRADVNNHVYTALCLGGSAGVVSLTPTLLLLRCSCRCEKPWRACRFRGRAVLCRWAAPDPPHSASSRMS